MENKTDNEILEEFKSSAKRLVDWRAAHPDSDLYINDEKLQTHEPCVSALKSNVMYEVIDRFFITDYHFHIERIAFIPIELYKAIRRKDETYIKENFPNLYQRDLGEDDE